MKRLLTFGKVACITIALSSCAPNYVAVKQNLDSKPSVKIAYVLSDYNEYVAGGSGAYTPNRFPDDKDGKFTVLGKAIQEILKTQWPDVKTGFNDRIIMFQPGVYAFNLEESDSSLAQMGQVKGADLVIFYSVAGNGRPGVAGQPASITYSQNGTQVNPGTKSGLDVTVYGIVSFVDGKTGKVLGTYRAGTVKKNVGSASEIGGLAPDLEAAFRPDFSALLGQIKSAKE